jgi:ubiquinone/menaquinone biosynthesis C-methylase UbiE
LVANGAVRAGSCVFELGCGTGNYIRALSERTGCVGWGLDPSSAMLAQAQSAVSRRLHWIHASAERTGLRDAQYDLTFCVDVVHHLSDRAAVFQEAHRVLRPNGTLCVATDSEDMIRCRAPLSLYWPETVEAELARYPSIGTLQAELHKADFVRLGQLEVESGGLLPDSGPFRAKVFSCLCALPAEVYQQGLARMEADLVKGPISFTSRYLLLWAYKCER